jgi:ATP-dependent Clp protease, protease subunit
MHDHAYSDRQPRLPLHGQDPEEPEEPGEPEERTRAPRLGKIALDILKKDRTILISEEVSPRLTERVFTQLLWLDSQSQDPIRLFINTPGGSADDGFAIFDAIRFIRSPVVNISMGLNASAGTIILLGTPRERRVALPNARIMIHQPSGGARGRASDIEITADELLKLRNRANELIAKECGRSLAQVEQDTNRDHWLSPEEALDYGLVSRVVRSVKDIG